MALSVVTRPLARVPVTPSSNHGASMSPPGATFHEQKTLSTKCAGLQSKLLGQEISDRHHTGIAGLYVGCEKPGARRSLKCRVQVADPLENSRDSFGNECLYEKEVRKKIELSDSYLEIAFEYKVTHSELVQAVSGENYERASGLKEQLDALQLRKRIIELFSKPRSLFRVGDVVRHKKYGYRGVVYGHDPLCSAPEAWKEVMKVDLLPGGADQPFYHVLVDAKDRPEGISTYVAQENLILQRNPLPVTHKWIEKFFVEFLDGTYIPKFKLRRVYPHDW